MTLTKGDRLAGYEILGELGSGGMGAVYQARDPKLNRVVAIKVLHADLASDPERLQRFEQEARAASSLNHPNIVTIHEVGEHDGVAFIAMEYVDGVTLRELLAEGALGNDKLVRYAMQIADGLAKAHDGGIVHRDLKPANIVVNDDGYVKILDFGLAKLMPEGDADELETMEKRTTPGTILGSVGYMAPEQAKGEPADFRSDQFALGAILYEMATGRRAFAGDSPAETLSSVLRESPAPVTLTNPKVPGHLAAVIDCCLEKDPNQRYDSTRDLAKEIHREQLVVPEPESHRHPLAGVGAVGALAVILVMLAAVLVPELRDWVGGSESASPEIGSLAVLPLDNLSGDPEQEYFVDGMTEALIASLAQLDDLKVISRTSVMRFKGERPPLAEIAQQLGVEAVVEGSVLKADDRVRITAQLIDTRTDEHLWAESYEGGLADVLKLQADVSQQIATEVSRMLMPVAASEVQVPPAAYDAYLRGRSFFNRRELDDAIARYEEATRLAPDYTDAYAGLAQAYAARRQVGLARLASDRALEIEPNHPIATTATALLYHWEWKWEESETQFRQAMELNPNDGFVRHAFGVLLSRFGRHDEAIELQRRALELDPMSPIINTEMGSRLYYAGRHQEALDAFDRALEIDATFGHAHMFRAFVLADEGRFEDALASVEVGTRVGSFLIPPGLLLGPIYARMGREDEARRYITDSDVGVDIAIAAFTLGALGDLDAAFEKLEVLYETKYADMSGFAVPWASPFHDDPRFDDFMRRMNFPGY